MLGYGDISVSKTSQSRLGAGGVRMVGFRLKLVAVWLLTGLLGAGLVDMFLEPDPSPRIQILLVIFLPVITIPAVIGLFAVGLARRGRDEPR